MQLPLSSTSEQEAGLAKPGTSSKWTETQRLGLGAKKPSSHPHVLRHCADGAGRVARCSPRKQKKQQRSSPQGGGSAKVMVALAVARPAMRDVTSSSNESDLAVHGAGIAASRTLLCLASGTKW